MVSSNKYKHPAQAIASYNFTELISNQGYITLYAYGTKNSGGTKDFYLTSQTPTSQVGAVASNNDTDPASSYEETIDSETFDQPIIVEGEALVNFGVGVVSSSGGGGSVYFEVELYHYDGTTETQLGSTYTTKSFPCSGAGNDSYDVALSKFTISETLFKIDDLLRIKVNIVPASYTSGCFGTDPGNWSYTRSQSDSDWGNATYEAQIDTTASKGTSQFILYLPVRRTDV